MTESERVIAIANTIDADMSDEQIVRDVRDIILDGMTARDVNISLSDDGLGGTKIEIDVDGISFTSKRLVFNSGSSRLEVQDHHGPSVLKKSR